MKSSHVDKEVNKNFKEWFQEIYCKFGDIKAVIGKKHDYLAMILDYADEGKLKVDMRYYIDSLIDNFSYKLNENTKIPWNDNLIQIDEKAKKVNNRRCAVLHKFLMKCMFWGKPGRPDVNPLVTFLSKRLKEPNKGGWTKLVRVLNFLKKSRDEVLTLEADATQTLTWYIDVAFAVHPDMKGHTGVVFTLGKGIIISESSKQKNNARNSTECELHGVDKKKGKVIWTKNFIKNQGFKVKLNLVYQENTSTLKLENNGKASSGKRTRHFVIKLFYVTDLIGRYELEV